MLLLVNAFVIIIGYFPFRCTFNYLLCINISAKEIKRYEIVKLILKD